MLRIGLILLLALAACDGRARPQVTPSPSPAGALDQKLDSGLNAAHRAIGAGQYAAARVEIANYLNARGNSARVAQAEFLLGLSYHEAQLYAEALPHFDRAHELEPGYLANHYYRGLSALNLGQLAKARASFEIYLKAQPEKAEALFGMALVEIEEDRAQEAEQHILMAIALAEQRFADPREFADARRDLGRYHARLGDVYLRMEKLGEARKALEKSIEFVPDLPEPWSKLQRVLVRLGDDEAAHRAEARWRELESKRAKVPR